MVPGPGNRTADEAMSEHQLTDAELKECLKLLEPLFELQQEHRRQEEAHFRRYGSGLDQFLRMVADSKDSSEAYKAMLPDYASPCLSPTLARIAQ